MSAPAALGRFWSLGQDLAHPGTSYRSLECVSLSQGPGT